MNKPPQTHVWFYISEGWLEDDKMGPFPEPEFLSMIRNGDLKPKMAVGSPTRTQGQWFELQQVASLKQAYFTGTAERKADADRQAKLLAEEKARRKDERARQRSAELEARSIAEMQAQQERKALQAQQKFKSETRPAFDRYWMPACLHAVWGLCVVVAILGVLLGTIALASAMIDLERGGTATDVVVIGFMGALCSVVAVLYLTVARLILESVAVLFDIRGLLVKQDQRQSNSHD